MNERKTLTEAIEELRTQTGASTSFVQRVESELISRGIPLDEDAEPYLESLQEAFLQDLCKREDTQFVRSNLDHLEATYFNLKDEHDRLSIRMEAIAEALRKHMPFENDSPEMTLVPGPTTIQ